MWSDVVLGVERLHFLRLIFWGAAATVAGTALLVLSMSQPRASAMIGRFAFTCTVLGAAELIFGLIGYHNLGLRNLAGATRLERLAWLQLGLYLGLTAVGATTAFVARSVAPRAASETDAALPAIGTGVAVALHGLALSTLELLLIAAISR